MTRRLAALFALALAIRVTYDLAVFAAMGPSGLMGPDSYGYMDLAGRLASGEAGFFTADAPVLNLMPLFPWLLWLVTAPFGAAPLPYVLLQALLDSATCVLVARAAAGLTPGLLMPAGILAALNPTQIVMAGMVYPDTLFLFFTTAMLASALAWLRQPSWGRSAAAGLALGLATFTRMLALPWAFILPALLLAGLLLQRRVRAAHVAQAALATALCLVVVAPIAARNRIAHDSWMLTNQTGAHFLYWVVPLVYETAGGTPLEATRARIARLEKDRGITGSEPIFQLAAARQDLALELLWQAGPIALLKAWTFGAALNIATPAVVISPPVSTMPHASFYQTVGSGVFDKARRFLFVTAGVTYRTVLLIAASGVLIWLGLAVAGVISAIRLRDPLMSLQIALLALWAVYILAVNGPVAIPKYRLPLEPVWIMLAALGVRDLLDRIRAARVPAPSRGDRLSAENRGPIQAGTDLE